MDIIQAFLLALIQGLTEFLPISSSAHLILPAQLLGWQDQGLAFDVAVHVGSLMAVLTYFRRDIHSMIHASWRQLRFGERSSEASLSWMVAVATVPAVLAALLFNDVIEQQLRSTAVIATTTIVFGVLLGIAELRSRRQSSYRHISWFIAIAVGCAQALALVPGTSRSGITMTAAVLLGLSRTDAARFSFLLSIPIILAAGLHESIKLLQDGMHYPWMLLLMATAVSGISAYLCIDFFLRWIEKIGLMPFVLYRLVLGAVLILLFIL